MSCGVTGDTSCISVEIFYGRVVIIRHLEYQLTLQGMLDTSQKGFNHTSIEMS